DLLLVTLTFPGCSKYHSRVSPGSTFTYEGLKAPPIFTPFTYALHFGADATKSTFPLVPGNVYVYVSLFPEPLYDLLLAGEILPVFELKAYQVPLALPRTVT